MTGFIRLEKLVLGLFFVLPLITIPHREAINTYVNKLVRSILRPIAIKINPPTISILLPIMAPRLLPTRTARKDKNAVITPMITLGYQISNFNIARLNPMAKASMLVAIDRITNDIPLVRSRLF